MVGGYMGKMLFIDLSNNKTEVEKLDYDFARKYLGGYGFASKILYEKMKSNSDPLGEDNIFGIAAGPLTGTPLPVVSRYTIFGRSPLTNSWGDANGSGFFGPTLKFAGYDNIFISGISEKPVYLYVKGSKVVLRDATDLWGKDTYATEDIIKEKYGKKAEIACIGPAGEKLSRLAGVVTAKGRTAARCGLGAVMGSKRLKGIVVEGAAQVPIARPDVAGELRKKYTKQIRDHYGFAASYATTGTPGYVEAGALNGDSPVKNWYGIGIKDLKDLSQYEFENLERYITRKNSCYRCPMVCWGHMLIKDGQYAMEDETHIPEYESTSALGSYLLNTNYESIITCNDICNRYGIDTISAGATIAFAINCYEVGIISKKDTDGIELTWGNHQSIVKMIEKLAKREGFGDVLADGVKRSSEIIGKGSEKFAIHIGGQEIPAHDTRFEPSMATIYQLDATPGRHTQAAQYCLPPDLPEILPDVDFSFSFGNKRDIFTGRAKAQRVLSALNHCVNSLGMCLFGFLSTSGNFMAECYSAVTGWDVDLDELFVTGERIGTVRLAFALRDGHNPLKLKFPDIVLGRPPFREGPTKDVTLDIESLVKEFCEEMDWDSKTCKPSIKKLNELGLNWLVEDLWETPNTK
jgi:aldehyde:ferredoxin oxidoreductase